MELKTYFAQDAAGNIISSAIVNVFLQGTTTLATGLTRADGTPLENPFAADGAGRIQFRAPDGYYDIQVSAGSGIIQTLTIQCVDYSGAKADADRSEAAADRADVSAEQARNALNSITGINTNFEQNSREQWRRSLEEAGLALVDGSFEEGATVNNKTDAVWHIAVGQCYFWDDAFPKAVPSGSTPTSTGGIGLGAWVSVGGASLRSNLADGENKLVAYKQTTVSDRLSKAVFITDFGGGESVADNLTAFNSAKTAAGTGGSVSFPKQAAGIYNFSAFPDMTGIVINPDIGVVLQGPASNNAVNPGIVTTRDYRVYFNSGDPKDYYIDMRANVHAGSKGANKSLWLNEEDISDSRPTPVDASTILVKQVQLGLSDTFTNVIPAARSASSLFLQPPSGGNTQLGVVQAVPGNELKVGVNNIPDNGGEIAVGLIATGGYMVLRGYPSSGLWSQSFKWEGKPSQDIAVFHDGGGTATYSASNNLITVRCISPIRAQILINGVSVVDFNVPSFAGSLQWVGVGATSIASVSGSNFTGWYLRKFKVSSSPRSQVLGIIGDSISDGAVDGSWPVWAAEALDGSLGIRINRIENRAISGQTLDQQIANLAANPFVDASVVAIFIGTNDIQGGNTLSAFQTSMTTLLNTLQSQGRQSVLIIPPQWYLQSDTPTGSGGASTNSSKGGGIRAAIGRIAAEWGLQVVDLTCVTGPVNPGYLSSVFADAVIRDNVHPTAYAYRFFGYEIARAIAARICPVVKIPSDWVSFTTFASGVTGNAEYRYTACGVEFRGKLEASTALNGTILTIPEGIRPNTTRYFIQWGNVGSVPTVFNTDGTVIIHNNPASNQISLDGVFLANE